MKRLRTHVVGVAASMCVFVFPSLVIAQGPGSNLNQQVAALQARMTDAETRLSAAEGLVSALMTENANQASQIAAAATRLTAVETALNTLTTASQNQAVQIVALRAQQMPVGTIIAYSAETPPAGYLECDGSQVLRADYPRLFVAIGTAFGPGDGSSTFNVPDLRGLFLRGWSHGSSIGFDPDSNARSMFMPGGATGDHVGSLQDHQLLQHNHSLSSQGLNLLSFTAHAIVGGPAFGSINTFTGDVIGGHSGAETRPTNLYVMYAIKY